MSKTTAQRLAGFSLVEVVIAVGIVAFVVIAIIGLLSVGLQNSRESAEDTNLALMTQTTSSLLRSLPFQTVLTNTNYASNSISGYFFDANGDLTRTASGAPSPTNNSDSLYACVVTRRTPPTNQLSSSNFIYLQYKFTRLNVPATNQIPKIVLGSVANYE